MYFSKTRFLAFAAMCVIVAVAMPAMAASLFSEDFTTGGTGQLSGSYDGGTFNGAETGLET